MAIIQSHSQRILGSTVLSVSKYDGMWWDCAADGCFNRLKRLKLEKFAECFPGKINFTDVDALVEINGYFCLMEWKGRGGSLKKGQEIMVRQFTRSRGNLVIVVEADTERMVVYRYFICWDGRPREWIEGSFDNLCEIIRRWSDWAIGQPKRIA